jgi:hypothetical protein
VAREIVLTSEGKERLERELAQLKKPGAGRRSLSACARRSRWDAEVRDELGYVDLTPSIDANERVVGQFSRVIPGVAEARRSAWALAAPLLLDHFCILS